jgi:tetratricopeptide (TPR) repeat protein
MRKHFFITFLLVYVLSACFTKRKTELVQFSTAEFPYIESFHEGVRLKLRGQYNEAITSFEKCLQWKSDQDAVYYALSELYLLKNEPQRSAEYIQKAALLDPNNKWYIQELAFMYFEQGKYSEAIKQFGKLLKLEPQNVEWLYGYAESLSKVGKTTEAIKALDRTEEQVGVQPELSIQKFQLYLESKQVERGIAEIQKALKLFPEDPALLGVLVDYYFQTKQESKALEVLETLVKMNPNNGRAHLALADVYRQQGRVKDSYRELKFAFLSDDVDIDTKMKILINFQEMNFKIEPEIFELVDIMVTKYPTEAKAHSIHGDYLNDAGKSSEALSAYKEALKYDKKEYPIWKQVLIMEYESSSFEELYQDSKVCLEYFPSIPTVYLLNGIGANQTRRFREALATLDTGKEWIVNDVKLEAEFYGQMGEAQFGLLNFKDGKVNFEKAMQLDPSSMLLKNNYAYQLALAKTDLTKAEELIDIVIIKEGSVGQFLDTKGWIFFQMGKYNESVRMLEDAYHAQPSDKYIVEHLGDAHAKNGDINAALEYWKRALELGSENKVLRKKIEKKEYYDPTY